MPSSRSFRRVVLVWLFRAWAFVCWCVEKGLNKGIIWEEVKGIGKFAERGRDYFDLTWENAEQRIREQIWQRGTGSQGCIGSSDSGGDEDSLPSDTLNGPDDRPPERTPILITTDEYQVNDQAIAVLSDARKTPELFQRGNMLVHMLRDSLPKELITRPPGSPRIAPLSPPNLRELLTRVAQFTVLKDDEIRPAHPPEWCVSAVAARGHWPRIRHLEAVIETPTMRPDGSILSVPGRDSQTGLLYEPNAEYLFVPETPSLTDAQEAAQLLLDVVVDFPFANPAHRVAWLTGVLSVVARSGIIGPCPLFLLEGNSPGAGKSLLADLIALIAVGRLMSRTAYPDNDGELRKRITAIALAGDRLMLLDNIATAFGGSALDAALTACTWRDRLLCRSEMTAELPLHTVWFGTGNNVALKGDITRRVILSRLETRLERPEERTGFRHPELIEYVRAERPRLVRAALTILRAFVVAGRPPQNLPAFGSFESWSRLVRSAVNWATGIDPCATRQGLREIDAKLSNLALLLTGWAELPNGRTTGLIVAEALDHLNNYQNRLRYATLRSALMEFSRNDKLPTPAAIGARLRSLRGQVVHGMSLHASTVHGGAQRWRVVHSDAGVSGDDGDGGDGILTPIP
jgi:hypothetical protein